MLKQCIYELFAFNSVVRVRLLCNKRAISCSLNAIQIRASLPLLRMYDGAVESELIRKTCENF